MPKSVANRSDARHRFAVQVVGAGADRRKVSAAEVFCL